MQKANNAEVQSLATVRIFKIAELLGTTSQEVTALLKRDHGIEVKSASSTIEEVVARQFVDRLSKQRNIQLPGGNIFAETPAAKGKKPAPAKKAAEPVKPAAPSLPPPRLVKTAKPAAAVAEQEPAAELPPSDAEPIAPETSIAAAEMPAAGAESAVERPAPAGGLRQDQAARISARGDAPAATPQPPGPSPP